MVFGEGDQGGGHGSREGEPKQLGLELCFPLELLHVKFSQS
jgi:hypothetical protein